MFDAVLTVLILLSAVLICAGITELASRVVALWRSARQIRPQGSQIRFRRWCKSPVLLIRVV